MKMEELLKKTSPNMPDKKSVGKSSIEEKIYGAVGVQRRCNVPKDYDSPPIEEEWHSDLEVDEYVDFLLVPDLAVPNRVGTNLFQYAKRLAISKGMDRIFMHGAGMIVLSESLIYVHDACHLIWVERDQAGRAVF
ncbi:hypothetical protein Tco_1025766 [Tanacetum coccineum]